MRRRFREFWRHTDWGRQVHDPLTRRKRSRRDTGFLLGLEVGPSGNVHLHVIVHGEYIPQVILQRLWSDTVGDLAIVHVRAVRGSGGLPGALAYTVKYVLKGEKGSRPQPERAAAVEYALKAVRRVEIGGAFRLATSRAHEESGEDSRPEDVAESRGGSCEWCGVVGRWEWEGRLAPGDVGAVGGFGLLQLERRVVISAAAEPDPDQEERVAQQEGA
jgi:hypothetical protein